MIKKTRDSNGELLRLIAQFGIILYHFCNNSQPVKFNEKIPFDMKDKITVLISGFSLPLTNCFALLSGYYRIKFSFRGIFVMYLTVLSYKTFSNILNYYEKGTFQDKSLFFFLLCISQSTLWYVKVYFALYIVSPLINKGYSLLQKREKICILVGLGIISIHMVYYLRVKDSMGVDFPQVLFLYFAGLCIKEYCNENTFKKLRWPGLIMYICTCLLWAKRAFDVHVRQVPGFTIFSHNSPYNNVSALCFFFFIMSFKFQNNFINAIAPGTFGAYVFQESHFFGYKKVHPFMKKKVAETLAKLPKSYVNASTPDLVVILYSAIFYIIALLIEYIRRKATNPLVELVGRVDNLLEKLDSEPELPLTKKEHD